MGKSGTAALSSYYLTTLFFIICYLLLTLAIGPGSAVTSDGCDWMGSGLSGTASAGSSTASQERGVQPLYLRCRQGRIKWSYPSGALRVLLRLQGSSKEFRACLRPGPVFQGARIYLEGHRRLHLLYSPENSGQNEVAHNDVSSQKVRCFASVRGQVALYVEATPPTVHSLKKSVAEFAYDLHPLDKRSYQDDLQECRPCSDQEILEAFCTSDFVARGSVTSLYHNEASGLSELTVHANQVLRDNEPQVFKTNTSVFKSGVLHRDIKCGTKAGTGQFLFLGRRILDIHYLVCAPRIGQWKKIRTKALMDNSHQCQLD